MRKMLALVLVLILMCLAGCSDVSLRIVNPDGSMSEAFRNGHMEITALNKYGKVTINVKNTSEETIVMFWPEYNLTLPDGCALSIGYMSYGTTQNYRSVFNKATGMVEIDTSGSSKYQHTEDMAGTRYIDSSPFSIGPTQTVGFLLGIVTAPVSSSETKASDEATGIRSTNLAAWINKMIPGERMIWRFSYRLMESGLAYDTEVVLEIAGK
jgi:hypothetical protein